MTAWCKLCGYMITGGTVNPAVKFSLNAIDAQMQVELQEFDLLGAATAQHIGIRHPKEAQALTAVANLSAKVYAMRLAQSSADNFEALRGSWSETIKQAIFGIQAADETPSSGGSSPSSSSPLPC